MNTDSLLDQLAPLREPTSIGWWPLAPGWWLVLVIGAVLIVLLSRAPLVRWRNNHYRRLAMREIKVLKGKDCATVEQVNRLLKATALRTWPEREVAALHGAEWLQMLSNSTPKAGHHWMASLDQVYRTPNSPASDELLRGAAHWIRHHTAHKNRTET